MFNVYQHWDPLRICVVGRTYPPGFYSWIKTARVRNLFERIASETEEDLDALCQKLREFHIEVLRPELPLLHPLQKKYPKPPMTPRDVMCMIGQRFYECTSHDLRSSYRNVKDPSWPECKDWTEFINLPYDIQIECLDQRGFQYFFDSNTDNCYRAIFNRINLEGNEIRRHIAPTEILNGAQISRIGKDLYFGTQCSNSDTHGLKALIDREMQDTRNHVINTGGHSDGTFCPVCPGLIISLYDVPTYAETFPDWEVVYLPGQSWGVVKPFLDLKEKNSGKWWIPGWEYDPAVVNVVDTWLDHWVGYVAETVFDVNMLIIDPKNVILSGENDLVLDALARHGITPHVVPLRHRYFWDGGVHCLTADLHRDGSLQDFFPMRNWT